MNAQTFIVGRLDAEQTLAAFIRVRLNVPWSKAKKIVEGGHVRVAGQPITDVAHRLKLGKRVEVLTESTKSKPKAAPVTRRAKLPDAPKYDGPAPVLVYSDDALVVVDKPAGLTTMRHDDEAAEFGERGRTFLPVTLAELLPAMLGRPGKPVHAVHRIDRDTTGLVVFARTKVAEKHLTEQFKAHSIERRYWAIVRGNPENGTLESVFVRDRGDGRRGSSTTEEGQRAVTHVEVEERFGAFALVECRLETGRTHQVRIHLGEAGWPLCGEKVYDRPLNGRPYPDGSQATRPMLHAMRLGLVHPITGNALRWDAPMPADMLDLLQRLRSQATPDDE